MQATNLRGAQMCSGNAGQPKTIAGQPQAIAGRSNAVARQSKECRRALSSAGQLKAYRCAQEAALRG
eukprot:1153386-Pelagomonas_calceolata.AAC.2